MGHVRPLRCEVFDALHKTVSDFQFHIDTAFENVSMTSTYKERCFMIQNVDHTWNNFLQKTKGLLKVYGSVIVYYVKGTSPEEWEKKVGSDHDQWSACDVLNQIRRQWSALEKVGADEQLFDLSFDVELSFEFEPQTNEDRLKLFSKMKKVVDLLPFVDLFPFRKDEKRSDHTRNMQRLCGLFSTLKQKWLLPNRWFEYTAKKFTIALEKIPKLDIKSIREILSETLPREKESSGTDSDEEFLYTSCVISGEPLEGRLEYIRKKRKYRAYLEERFKEATREALEQQTKRFAQTPETEKSEETTSIDPSIVEKTGKKSSTDSAERKNLETSSSKDGTETETPEDTTPTDPSCNLPEEAPSKKARVASSMEK